MIYIHTLLVLCAIAMFSVNCAVLPDNKSASLGYGISKSSDLEFINEEELKDIIKLERLLKLISYETKLNDLQNELSDDSEGIHWSSSINKRPFKLLRVGRSVPQIPKIKNWRK